MTALRFTREAIPVEAMRLEYFGDMVIARQWLGERGAASHVATSAPGTWGLFLTGRPEPARVGQWLVWEPDTGWVDVLDGDEHAPDGCTGGLGMA